jgi:hypothetical protein
MYRDKTFNSESFDGVKVIERQREGRTGPPQKLRRIMSRSGTLSHLDRFLTCSLSCEEGRTLSFTFSRTLLEMSPRSTSIRCLSRTSVHIIALCNLGSLDILSSVVLQLLLHYGFSCGAWRARRGMLDMPQAKLPEAIRVTPSCLGAYFPIKE